MKNMYLKPVSLNSYQSPSIPVFLIQQCLVEHDCTPSGALFDSVEKLQHCSRNEDAHRRKQNL